ncbi:hypothetical protein CDL12_13874 [Handroanthus impetiginosus]|uniref:Uncharacterized protein n=1 Tax=Handroanthus impetiginosus TaxID=429701 RepID=A0A2G9H7K2_9LAMI|nr:hypothetical protein CDL12_13874 [Handroanthus impetiginosus]
MIKLSERRKDVEKETSRSKDQAYLNSCCFCLISSDVKARFGGSGSLELAGT